MMTPSITVPAPYLAVSSKHVAFKFKCKLHPDMHHFHTNVMVPRTVQMSGIAKLPVTTPQLISMVAEIVERYVHLLKDKAKQYKPLGSQWLFDEILPLSPATLMPFGSFDDPPEQPQDDDFIDSTQGDEEEP